MRLLSIALFLMLTAFWLGCTSSSSSNRVYKFTPVSHSEIDLQDMSLTQKETQVQNEINNLIQECRPVLTNFEDESKKGAKKAYYLSMTGLLAGAVGVPALTAASAAGNAAWISGLGGLAGATNTASEVFKTSGLSGAFAAQDRNNIINRIRDQLDKVFSGNSSEPEKLDAIAKAKAECALYLITIPSVPEVTTSD